MYSYCKIKNIDEIDHSVMGTILSPNDEYVVQDTLRLSISNNDTILEKIATGKLQVYNNIEAIISISDQLNHLKSISNNEVDEEGRQVNRIAAAKKGWTYLAHFFEFKTSEDDSLFCEDWQGSTDTSLSIKFYKANGSEITDAGAYSTKQEHLDNECVKTEVLFKPSFDYELVSGSIRLDTAISNDCRLWVIGGVIELGTAGTKEFARGMNLNFLGADEIIETDGRASKYMSKDITGIPYQANQLKFILKHEAGVKVKIMPTLEYFRG